MPQAAAMRRIYRRRLMKARFWSVGVLLLAAVALALRLTHVMAPVPEAGILLRIAVWAPAAFLALGFAWLASGYWNAVARFEVDLDSGRFRARLWRPLGWRRLEGSLGDISGWHYERDGRPRIRARLDTPRHELAFGLAREQALDAAWRRIAPGAVAAYERDGGSCR